MLAESTMDDDGDSSAKKRRRPDKYCAHCNAWVSNTTFYRHLRDYGPMCRPHNAEKNPVSSTESAYVAGFQGMVNT